MFGLFRKNEPANELLETPIVGKVVPSAEVPDPTFSEEMLGRGLAIWPAEGKVYAPADGVLSLVFETKHALSVTSDLGTQILIHVGLDTVTLKGAPFIVHVEQGSRVKKGDLLMSFDLEMIKEAGLSAISPIIICNCAEMKDVLAHTGFDASKGDTVLEIVH